MRAYHLSTYEAPSHAGTVRIHGALTSAPEEGDRLRVGKVLWYLRVRGVNAGPGPIRWYGQFI